MAHVPLIPIGEKRDRIADDRTFEDIDGPYPVS